MIITYYKSESDLNRVELNPHLDPSQQENIIVQTHNILSHNRLIIKLYNYKAIQNKYSKCSNNTFKMQRIITVISSNFPVTFNIVQGHQHVYSINKA